MLATVETKPAPIRWGLPDFGWAWVAMTAYCRCCRTETKPPRCTGPVNSWVW